MELASGPLAIVAMEKFGRKKSSSALFLLAGSMCIGSSILTSRLATGSGEFYEFDDGLAYRTIRG